MSDWRSDLLDSLPDRKTSFRIVTFETAEDLMKTAAYNRRMHVEEFAGRAALAVAVYDLQENWAQVTRKEPPLRDVRRHRMPAKRLYGKKFGPWTIEEMK